MRTAQNFRVKSLASSDEKKYYQLYQHSWSPGYLLHISHPPPSLVLKKFVAALIVIIIIIIISIIIIIILKIYIVQLSLKMIRTSVLYMEMKN